MGRRPIEEVDTQQDIEDLAPPPERNERLEAIKDVAGDFTMWRPAREVLTTVRSVKTIFPQFDRATRVSGYPIERFNVIHGPSSNGKTTAAIGFGLSFLMGHHFYAHIDAEMTTPGDWVSGLMGRWAESPGFLALRPNDYEQTIDAVKQLCEGVGTAKIKGRLPEDTSALVVVDSIRKLMPKDLLAKIKKEGAEGLGGRAGQLKAAMNQAWLDQLTPMLNHTGTSVLAIARESDDPNADAMAHKFDSAWKVGGGQGIIYDASLVIRAKRAGYVRESADKKSRVFGERIKLTIWKTKVEGKDDKHVECYFHTSNGVAYPAGFDTARDIFELAVHYGVVEKAGAWFSYNGERLGQGENNALTLLRGNPKVLNHIEDAVRQEFTPEEELQHSEDEDEDPGDE